jgi:single-stranded DNA-binding protein
MRIRMRNEVTFEGRIVTTPIYNHTKKNNSLVANFRLGNTRRYFTAHDEEKLERCYANVVAWVKVAEYCQSIDLGVGDLIVVYGSLKNKESDNELEIVGRSIKFLRKRRGSDGNENDQVSDDQSRQSP